MIRVVHPGSGSDFLHIPDPGVKESPDPESGSATLFSCCVSHLVSSEYVGESVYAVDAVQGVGVRRKLIPLTICDQPWPDSCNNIAGGHLPKSPKRMRIKSLLYKLTLFNSRFLLWWIIIILDNDENHPEAKGIWFSVLSYEKLMFWFWKQYCIWKNNYFCPTKIKVCCTGTRCTAPVGPVLLGEKTVVFSTRIPVLY